MNDLNSLSGASIRSMQMHGMQVQSNQASPPPASQALNLIVNRLSGQIDRASDVSDRLSVFADRLLGVRPIKGSCGGETAGECGMIERINDMLSRLNTIIEATAETASALESV